MNSLDSKVTQYLYAINKLQLFISSLKRLSSRENIKDLPLCQYLVLLTGNVFSINESLFNPRLDIISQFKLFKNTPITISSTVTHVPYDTQDLQITSLAELPTAERANKVLKLLESLCFNCLQAYQKRLQQAKIERRPSDPEFFSKLEDIIKNDIFDEKLDLDLDLTDSKVLLNLPSNPNLLNNEDFIEATLVDMDIRMLFAVNSSIQATVEKLKVQISKYLLIKKSASPEKYLASIADDQDGAGESFTMHRLCALAIRLNELYIIFRKIGRKVYFSNYDHLYDSKFLFQSKNQNYFKMHLLKDMDDVFNTTRKNGTLIATLTRFFRQGAQYESNVKNVNDFVNFINQGQMMLSGCLNKVDEFSLNWLTSELRFRKVYGLPKKILTDLYTQQTQAEHEGSTSGVKSRGTPNGKTTYINGSDFDINTDLNNFKISSSRSSSITSQTSIPSSITTPSKPLVRRTSVNRNSMIVSPSPTSKNQTNGVSVGTSDSPIRNGNYASPSRPQSMIFMNTNSSLSSLPSQKPSLQQRLIAEGSNPSITVTSDSTPTMAGRRRSNSQPIKPSENLLASTSTSSNSASAAASGAASALRNNLARSPSGSIKRNGSVSRSSPVPKQLISVEEEIVQQGPPQLTANQRLQQHLKQAAKQGSLMTQQKETFSSVVFDPNSPSSINLRPHPKPQVTEKNSPPPQSAQSAPASQLQASVKTTPQQGLAPPSAPVPKTRDQVTRLNTRRNSVNQPIPAPTLGPSASSTSSMSTLSDAASNTVVSNNNLSNETETFKKVRFTGVPDYNEAEDAPTSYSSRILKNFAAFKSPIPSSKPTFKRKDQMLKKEESISFKSQLHSPIPPENVTGFQIPPANANPISGTRLSKLKNKII
ncbi:hypothetical protein CLIB1423_02S01816 [[Candida] railenensis]|uniref:Uncharacterized protein n=1 Tax=[Candida] railenensis TaxID=45579 RepID=A0A9P0QLC5_9ASCO|nr:hypothetical protein CLIB1423_02S01816 [[Candida] railenensis]